MERLAEGDRGAFDPLFAALWPRVLRFAERAVGPADGADAAQTGLSKVFLHAHAFDPERDAVAWIFGIVAFECRTLRTLARRRREDPASVDVASSQAAEDAIIRRDLEHAFLEAIEEVSLADREILLSVLAGDGPDVRGVSYRKRLSRAIGRLRQIWRSKHDTDG